MSSREDDGGEQAQGESDEQTCEPRELFLGAWAAQHGWTARHRVRERERRRGGEGAQAIRSWKIGESEYLWAVAAHSPRSLCAVLSHFRNSAALEQSRT